MFDSRQREDDAGIHAVVEAACRDRRRSVAVAIHEVGHVDSLRKPIGRGAARREVHVVDPVGQRVRSTHEAPQREASPVGPLGLFGADLTVACWAQCVRRLNRHAFGGAPEEWRVRVVLEGPGETYAERAGSIGALCLADLLDHNDVWRLNLDGDGCNVGLASAAHIPGHDGPRTRSSGHPLSLTCQVADSNVGGNRHGLS
jgi:hypothetical protein